MFITTINALLLEFQQRLGTNIAIPWGWLFTKLLSLLARYPTGVTKAILLAELESSWRKIEKHHSMGTSHDTYDVFSSISLTKQLSSQAVFEVYLQEVTFVEGTHTRIGVMRGSQSRGSCLTMEMYLHQKLYDIEDEIMAHNYKLRFTGCRLIESRGKKSTKLLPSESFIILIDQESMERLCQCFVTLEGLDQHSECKYINDIKVKVIEISKPESIHYQNGQTANKITVVVVDDLAIHAKFILWEEYLVMANLFEEGDLLFIKKCFLVPDENECYTLEYGPETVIFCYPVVHEQQLVPSQRDSSKFLCVARDNKGKLDCSMYPERLRICEIKSDMTNVTLFGQVVYVGNKRLLSAGDGIRKVEYLIKIEDESGICTVMVTDQFKGTVVYCGQFVLMKDLFLSNDNNVELTLQLNSEKGSTWWNVSALEGWLTTSSICTVTSLRSLDASCKQCVVKGIITDLRARVGKDSTVRVHCSCDSELTQNMEDHYSCSECNSSGMVEMPMKSVPMLFSLDKFWRCRYDLRITIMESDDKNIEVKITDDVAEKLLQLPARRFQELGQGSQRRIFECTLGQECYFGMSNLNGEFLVGVVRQM